MMSGRDSGWAGQVGLSARASARGNRARVGLEPAAGPAAPTATNHRRRSLDHLMENSVHERMQSTKQLQVTKTQSGATRLVEGRELVPKGCLSKATGDCLVEVALGEVETEVGPLKVVQCFLAIMLVPPLLSSLIWGFYPYVPVRSSGASAKQWGASECASAPHIPVVACLVPVVRLQERA